MESWRPFVELKTNSGAPVNRGSVTVTPEAQALVVRLPYVGFVWNRPVAVVVEQDGRRERFPIFDVTRAVIMTMAGAAALISVIVVVAGFLGRK